MREIPNVLLLADDGPTRSRLQTILQGSARVVTADDLPEALAVLAKGSFDVVFCDWQFHCGTWRDALDRSSALYPEMPLIVVGQTGEPDGETGPWAEVVGAGGFDLLPAGREEDAPALLEHAFASREARALRAIA